MAHHSRLCRSVDRSTPATTIASGGFYAATIKVVNLEKDRTVTDSVSAPAVGDAMIGILTDLDAATWKNINVTNYVISSVRGIVTTGLGSTGTSDDYYNNVTIIK